MTDNQKNPAMTPPMGWNSWDCYGASVTEEIVRKNALYMAEHLKAFGWEYIVVDIQWSEPTAENHTYHNFAELEMDAYSRLQPAPNRFPSSAGGKGFGPLSAFVHDLGLKFGIHIMRGIPRQAVHRNTAILGSTVTARQIAAQHSVCPWNTDMYGVDPAREGAQAYYNSLFEQYAEWGVDFVKVDDIANHYPTAEIEQIEQAIRACGRPMVFSISPGPTPLQKAEHLKQHVNMWRITDDFWDHWEQLYDMFERAESWCIHACPGHFPDADMLPVGPILQDYGPDGWTGFTQDEQITMLTLWCMLRSPLMIGGELTGLDAFTRSLLTNPDILEILKHSHSAHPVYRRGEKGREEIVWMATHDTEGYYVALFNADLQEKEITVDIQQLSLPGEYTVTELWTGTDCPSGTRITAVVPAHGAKAYRLHRI
ncbi:MAG TPA: glycoside hydrolase family 27 protein [Firmicutes bacterium]|nr:glycoside hydrolase family 27 protein [Bacillota bacterium]